MRIAVDVMGGDHGCGVVIGGVSQALQNSTKISELFLVGQEEQIQSSLRQYGCNDPRIRLVHASQVLSMDDKPVEGLRKKKDCSLLRTVELVKDGKADAAISSGNTGGLVAAATIRLRLLDQVDRPAIATVIPSHKREFVLVDAGANPECKPLHLVQFAVMGRVYSREILGRPAPRVGLLSNGSEEIKGTELTRETVRLCKKLDLNFVGYVEGHDLFEDAVDVVVTDGFMGNIVLKTVESMGRGILRLLKEELGATPLRKLGVWLARTGFANIKRRMNPDIYGGAPLLGLNGTVIKVHGSAREFAVRNAIQQAAESVQHHIHLIIQKEIAEASDKISATASMAT